MSLTIRPAQIVEESTSPLLDAHPRWPRVPLGSVATILNGAAFKSSQFRRDEGIPLIRIRDISNAETSVRYSGEYDERYLIEPGELLVGMDGDFNVARWAGEPALLNQRVCCINPNAKSLDLSYLAYVLPGYLRAIHDVTSSTTVKHLSSRDVAEIPIPLPALALQRQIAERLDRIDERRATIAARLTATKQIVARFRGAVLAAAYSGRLTADWREEHPGSAPNSALALCRRQLNGSGLKAPRLNPHAAAELPESWQLAPLGLLLDDLRYGTSKRSAYDTKGVPVLRIPNVSSGSLTLDDLKFAPLDDRELASLQLRAGDLLMIRSNGSVGLVGMTALVPEAAQGMVYAGYLIRLRVDSELLDPGFLGIVLASPALRRQIELPARSTSGVHNINSEEVRSLGIPVPPPHEQRAIVHRTTAALGLANRLNAAISVASTTPDSVMKTALAKAFRGELVRPEVHLRIDGSEPSRAAADGSAVATP